MELVETVFFRPVTNRQQRRKAGGAVKLTWNQLLRCLFDVYLGVSENVVYPIVPNGFADHEIPFLNGYFIGNINPTFSDKPI